jgi:5-methylcytosine-specific restriction endonuclease McrA
MEQPESRVAPAAREFVFRRANGCCEYCLSQAVFSPSPFTMDHIVPRAAGGDNEVGNLVLACMGCNGHKHASQDSFDPLTGERARLYNPRQDAWSENFQWSDDYEYIIGVTSIGRATVARLHLNRSGVVNLRRSLRRLGLHPPQA